MKVTTKVIAGVAVYCVSLLAAIVGIVNCDVAVAVVAGLVCTGAIFAVSEALKSDRVLAGE